MTIRIHDTLSRQTRPLDPRDPGRVTIYGCGPTVYNYAHIGNARTFLWYDLMRRYLVYRGFDVTYVMNYTDVDDKMIERARLEGLPLEGIAAKYGKALEQDLAHLGVDPPDVLSLATDHIGEMVEAIEGLVERGFAYEAEGDVWFSVESFEGYGKLSGRTLEEMRAGERVEPASSKRHPLDFALWKSAKDGEPSWPSRWGPGRPGWHIECSVMSTKYLGMGFDIHGGGADLIFPHHENEIAQAEALAGSEPFARCWTHAGLVQMETEKMSKSIGNVALARDVVQRYPAEAVRYWALTGSYRTQLVFSEDALDDAVQAYERWRTFFEGAGHVLGDDMPQRPADARRAAEAEAAPNDHVARFIAAMDDDFNSAEALAAVHDLVREANKCLDGAQRGSPNDRDALVAFTTTFLEITSVLGFRFSSPAASSELTAGLIDYLLELREQARAERSFERADAIRARLRGLGVAIEDTPAGTRWRIAGA
ncbi:cysteine--tRNA ligase [soil metagenome]